MHFSLVPAPQRPHLGWMKIQSYPSDLRQEEGDFVAPYLTLMKEDAPQREHSLREVFNALRCAGPGWRAVAAAAT